MLQLDSMSGGSIVARSKPMQRVMSLVEKIAAWDVNLCLVGETGTAKEPLARAIHQGSPRRDRPFVSFADTGTADLSKAETGTLFIDELAALSPSLQAALLGLIQSRQPSRGCAPGRGDVRIITGTTQDLSQAIEAGAVREDLYYRAAAILIEVPPLRERRDDLPVLVDQILQRVARAQGKPVKPLTARALGFVLNHPWPGNERQLERCLEHAMALVGARDAIDLELLETAERAAAAAEVKRQRSLA
jgi:transcriptional regulator with PAS, ATPase and Fis domain